MEKNRQSIQSFFGKWGAIATSIGCILTVLAQLGFPEMFESIKEQRLIEDEVHKIALTFPDEIAKKYKKDSTHYAKILQVLNGRINNLSSTANRTRDIEEIKDEIKYIEKAISIQSDAIVEEMDKKTECEYVYYVTNGGDAWGQFNDRYNIRVLNSLDLRSDCRAYRLPIGSTDKIQVR